LNSASEFQENHQGAEAKVSGTASKPGVRESFDNKNELSRRMPEQPSNTKTNVTKKGMARFAGPLVVLVIVTAVYGSIYFREESISTGIGANLVPAERVLKGEVPYRDFYKIQTPGILLLNAGLFKLLGASLLTALRGVFVFKILTVVLVFVIARLIVPSTVAIIPALLAMIWLPPGGPFRPAPIQYEMLFILAAIYFMLRWIDSRNAIDVFAAGLAVGLVALFKQNVGVYTAAAFGLVIILNTRGLPRSFKDALRVYRDSWKTNARAHTVAAIGVGLPLAGLFIYLAINRALAAAARVFVKGPGEHIQMKFTGYPLPKHVVVILIAGAAVLIAAHYLSQKAPKHRTLIGVLVIFGACACAIISPQAAIDNSIYWFAPLLFAYAAWQYLKSGDGLGEFSEGTRERGVLLILLLFSMASYGEVFPRSVRGLLIGTMPPAFLLLTFLLGRVVSFDQTGEPVDASARNLFAPRGRRLVFAVMTIVLAVFALRVIVPHYVQFDSERGIGFKADTELAFERGRGVLLPNKRATEVTGSVEFIQSRVPEGGYFFAHALDATSYYFLADRNSPTGATLWNDAGTNDAERARTLKSLRDKQVRLVLTSEQAISTERFAPLLDHMKNSFYQSAAIGKLKFLERNY
jgi:hypothetical protein